MPKPESDIPVNSSNSSNFYQFLMYLLHDTDENRKKPLKLIEDEFQEIYKIHLSQHTIERYIRIIRDMGFTIEDEIVPPRNCIQYYSKNGFGQYRLFLLMLLVENTNYMSAANTESFMDFLLQFAPKDIQSRLKEIFHFVNVRKTDNEETVKTLETVILALIKQVMIRCKCYHPLYDGTKEYKHDGNYYLIEPVALIPDGCQIYLYGNIMTGSTSRYTHIRLDYLEDVQLEMRMVSDKAIEEQKHVAEKYNGIFKMFNGKDTEVTLEFKQSVLRSIYERFGHDVKPELVSGEGQDAKLRLTVHVKRSRFFYSWVAESQGEIQIVAPESVADSMARYYGHQNL